MTLPRFSGRIREVGSSNILSPQDLGLDPPLLSKDMPRLLKHAGTWKGTRNVYDFAGKLCDSSQIETHCSFPNGGNIHFVQRQKVSSKLNKTEVSPIEAVFQDGKLWINNNQFEGSAWEGDDGLFLFELFQKGKMHCSLREMIQSPIDGSHRTRSMLWCKNGQILQRSVFVEKRVD